jgi:paraquat-inducible protein B
MSKHGSPAVVGGFVVAALTLLAVAVLALGAGRVFRTRAHVIAYFEDSVGGLDVGAPVRFRGIEIGTVKDVRIDMTGVALDPRHVRLPVLLEIDEDRLRSEGARFVNLRDPQVIQQLVGDGLRASLATESLVGGTRYVDLDFRPDTPAQLVHDPSYPEIPTLRNPTGDIPDRIDRVLKNLEGADIPRLTDSLQNTVDDADQLLRSPHLARAEARLDEITLELEGTVTQLDSAARELRPTITSVRSTADRLSDGVDTTLRDISDAAHSLRRLTDQLARDPGSIVRGGKP